MFGIIVKDFSVLYLIWTENLWSDQHSICETVKHFLPTEMRYGSSKYTK
ncbi:hypothetical protein Pan14r_51110 [Crateriforma conspicua]|uniref:Uncharacterized protein n=1 Tax=Crateriforma conspicua TaxID=2527996 RepID=A0A5C5XRN6_9PLAN|nr:hypothetical protein Pan14r_51110 [Crateriforma conspicua]